ncbi:MAG: molybdate ABC transporter substrate-binding protein, partial [Candidatus Saccharimonadales bacterium]
MKHTETGWAEDWSLRLRVWAEREGKAVLGPGRVELLQAIDRWHSISAAARQIGMSYRHAWLLVQSVNKAAGKPLVESAIGGKQGGGARLTELGKQAVRVFRELQNEVQAAATQILPRVLQVDQRQTHLHVSAAISLEEVLGQLLADYALRQPAVRVRAIFGASNELADHILAGSPCDLFLSADAAQVARLARAGLAAATKPPGLARNGLAVVVPEDSQARLRRPADLSQPQLKRLAIADPESPLGKYTHDYLSQLGLRE